MFEVTLIAFKRRSLSLIIISSLYKKKKSKIIFKQKKIESKKFSSMHFIYIEIYVVNTHTHFFKLQVSMQKNFIHVRVTCKCKLL